MFANRLFGHAAIYTLSNLVVAGVPFLLIPFLTRVLEPADYGLVAMFSLIVSFMTVAVGLNVHGAISVRCLDNSNINIPKYVSTALLLLIFSTGIVILLVFVWGNLVVELTAIPLKWIYIAVLVAALQFIVQITLVLFQVFKRPIVYGSIRISNALLDTVTTIIFVIFMALSWQGRLGGMVVTIFFVSVAAIYLLIKEGLLSKNTSYSYAKDALGYGLPLVPHAIGGIFLSMADRFMVNNILDVSSTGIYVVAAQIGLVLSVFCDSFNKAFAPWLMEKLNNLNNESQNKIVVYTYIYFVMILSFAGIGALIAPYILHILVGEKFQVASSLLGYMLFGNAFVGMYYMVTNYIFYSRRTGLLSIITVVFGVFSIGINWILINLYGSEGAAIGFMCGQALLFLGTWSLANFCVPMPWFSVFIKTPRV
jgi:O-antigen/teichoic acid export membrane protein